MALNLDKRSEKERPLTHEELDGNWQKIEEAINVPSVTGTTAVYADVALEARVPMPLTHGFNSRYFSIEIWGVDDQDEEAVMLLNPAPCKVYIKDNPTAKFYLLSTVARTVTVIIHKASL